ncbi:MAG TPA: response regulator transcription factor, partial [Thermomicrobiales bacterium]|nr:response regulator transcription factor [Thermomicrobiales bacterium]
AWESGRRLDVAEVIEEASAWAPSPDMPTSVTQASTPGNDYGLTARELEVLRLLAEGQSSREIGETLFISYRTASTHVANIFGKLDVDNRAAAVAKALQKGLI